MSSDAPSPGETPIPADPTPAEPAPAAAPGPSQAAAEAQPAAATRDPAALRPEELTAEGLPTALRGYDRRRVDWLLLRASEAYAHVVRQRDSLRERSRSLEAEVAAAEGEARVSAASVAELTQRIAAAEDEARRAREARTEAEGRLAAVEGERAQALTDLEAATGRAAELDARVRELEEAERRHVEAAAERVVEVAATAPADVADEDAAGLLLAAVRAAEELRQSSRARALATLKRARERAVSLEAEVDREQAALAQMQDRRRDAERVASELLAQARAESERVAAERREAERLAAELGDERSRVRTFLAGALSALDPGGTGSEGILADLSSRLPEAGDRGEAVVPQSDSDQAD